MLCSQYFHNTQVYNSFFGLTLFLITFIHIFNYSSLIFYSVFEISFYSFFERERRTRDNEEKNEMWERDKWVENLKLMLKRMPEEERDIIFFSPCIFYLPSVRHPYKNRKQMDILKLERSISQSERPNFYFFTRAHLIENFSSCPIGRM